MSFPDAVAPPAVEERGATGARWEAADNGRQGAVFRMVPVEPNVRRHVRPLELDRRTSIPVDVKET